MLRSTLRPVRAGAKAVRPTRHANPNPVPHCSALLTPTPTQAAVTGDTVGDPFKDTVGPSLHVVITTMSTTILVLGPMFLGEVAPR